MEPQTKKVPAVTDETFETEVIKTPGYVMVDMWADWCTPCHMLEPHVELISEKLKGNLKVVSLDTDNNQRTAIQFQVMSLPTLLLFKDGEVVGQSVGFRPSPTILQWLEQKGVNITPTATAMPAAA